MKTLFLAALGLGRRVSEIHAVARHRNLLEFEDHLLRVKLNPNPKFPAENETVKFRNKPILIQLWKNCP